MWTKPLTLANKKEFIKWAQNVFTDIGSQSLPVHYVAQQLGFDEAYQFCLEWSGERQNVAFETWVRFWQDSGCPSIEKRSFYHIDLLSGDIYNKVPDSYYEEAFKQYAGYHPEYLYRYGLRSPEHINYIKTNYPESFQKFELLWTLDPEFNLRTEAEKQDQYWQSLVSDAYCQKSKVKNFLIEVKGKTQEVCQTCKPEYLPTLARSMLSNPDVAGILKVLLHHRPDLRAYFYNEVLPQNGRMDLDEVIYPCDEAYTFIDKNVKTLTRHNIKMKTLANLLRIAGPKLQILLSQCRVMGKCIDVMRLSEACSMHQCSFPASLDKQEYNWKIIALRAQWDEVLTLRHQLYGETPKVELKKSDTFNKIIKELGEKRLKNIKSVFNIEYFASLSEDNFKVLHSAISNRVSLYSSFPSQPFYMDLIPQFKKKASIISDKQEIELIF